MPDKKVNLSATAMTLTLTDDSGKTMATFNIGPAEYKDIDYQDAVDVEASILKAANDHMERMILKGKAKK